MSGLNAQRVGTMASVRLPERHCTLGLLSCFVPVFWPLKGQSFLGSPHWSLHTYPHPWLSLPSKHWWFPGRNFWPCPLWGSRFNGVKTFLYRLGRHSLNLSESLMWAPQLNKQGFIAHIASNLEGSACWRSFNSSIISRPASKLFSWLSEAVQ